MNTVTEKSAAVARKSAELDTAIARMRSIATGTMGSAARRSRATSAAVRTRPPAISARLGPDVQAKRPPPRMHSSVSAPVAAASSTAPAMSSGCSGRPGGRPGTRSCRPTSAATPTGRFTRKTQRQPAPSTSAPPTSGPMMVATANLVAAPLARGHQVADNRHRERHEPARGRALHGPHRDQLGDVGSDAAERGRRQEEDQRDLEQELAAMAVTELAPERRGGGRSDDVGADDPRDVAEAAEIAGDHRQGRRKDGLVEDGGKHGQNDRG